MGNTIASLIKRLEECRPEISSHLTFGLLVKMSRWMRWARSRSSVEAKYGTGLRSRESGSGWLEDATTRLIPAAAFRMIPCI